MNKKMKLDAIELIKQLLLTDPFSGESLVIASDFTNHNDNSYSFIVSDENNEQKWKHRIYTEEL